VLLFGIPLPCGPIAEAYPSLDVPVTALKSSNTGRPQLIQHVVEIILGAVNSIICWGIYHNNCEIPNPCLNLATRSLSFTGCQYTSAAAAFLEYQVYWWMFRRSNHDPAKQSPAPKQKFSSSGVVVRNTAAMWLYYGGVSVS